MSTKTTAADQRKQDENVAAHGNILFKSDANKTVPQQTFLGSVAPSLGTQRAASSGLDEGNRPKMQISGANNQKLSGGTTPFVLGDLSEPLRASPKKVVTEHSPIRQANYEKKTLVSLNGGALRDPMSKDSVKVITKSTSVQQLPKIQTAAKQGINMRVEMKLTPTVLGGTLPGDTLRYEEKPDDP